MDEMIVEDIIVENTNGKTVLSPEVGNYVF